MSKTIDWTKPIRFVNGVALVYHGEVKHGPGRIIETPDGCIHVRHASGECAFPNEVIENIPPPKKHYIRYGAVVQWTRGKAPFVVLYETLDMRAKHLAAVAIYGLVVHGQFLIDVEYEDNTECSDGQAEPADSGAGAGRDAGVPDCDCQKHPCQCGGKKQSHAG